MPRSSRTLALELRYGIDLTAIRRRIGRDLARLVTALDTEDLSASITSFVPVGSGVIAAGQLDAQRAAADFVAAFLASETGRAALPRDIAGDVAGRNSVGIPLTRVLGSSLSRGIFAMLRGGHSPAAALRHGAAAVTQLGQAEVVAAADREVGDQAGSLVGVSGWTWVLTGAEACAACGARADGSVRPFDEEMPRHPGCDCVRAVRMVDDPATFSQPTGEERFRSLTPAQQAAQFRTAGEEKAELVRSGKLSLADLVKVERHANWRTIVTERSLADVTGRA